MISNIEARDLKKPNIFVQIFNGNFQLYERIMSGESFFIRSKKENIDGDENRVLVIGDHLEGVISRKEKERKLNLPECQRKFRLVDIVDVMDFDEKK